jgi:hypothetical protein
MNTVNFQSIKLVSIQTIVDCLHILLLLIFVLKIIFSTKFMKYVDMILLRR